MKNRLEQAIVWLLGWSFLWLRSAAEVAQLNLEAWAAENWHRKESEQTPRTRVPRPSRLSCFVYRVFLRRELRRAEAAHHTAWMQWEEQLDTVGRTVTGSPPDATVEEIEALIWSRGGLVVIMRDLECDFPELERTHQELTAAEKLVQRLESRLRNARRSTWA